MSTQSLIGELPLEVWALIFQSFTDKELTQFRTCSKTCYAVVDPSLLASRLSRSLSSINDQTYLYRTTLTKMRWVKNYFMRLNDSNSLYSQNYAPAFREGFFFNEHHYSVIEDIFNSTNGNTIIEQLSSAVRTTVLKKIFSCSLVQIANIIEHCDMGNLYKFIPSEIENFLIFRNGTMWQEQTIQSITKFRSLKQLCIGNLTNLENVNFGFLTEIPTLNHFILGGMDLDAPCRLKNLSFLSHLSSISSLEIQGLEILDQDPLQYCATLTQLTHLNIMTHKNNGNHIRDSSPLSQLVNLTSLFILDPSSRFADPTLKDIKELTALEQLDLTLTIGDQFSTHLTTLKNLNYLNIVSYLNGEPIEFLNALNKLTKLKTLSFFQAKFELTDAVFCSRDRLLRSVNNPFSFQLITFGTVHYERQPPLSNN